MARNIHRQWLQPKNTGVDSYVKVTIGEDNNPFHSLTIADCNRSVTLEFNINKSWGLTKKQAITKLNKIRKALDLIEEAINRKE